MSHNNNTSDHLRLQPASGAAISGGVSGNNVHELSSSVRRTLLRCCHCDTVNAHYQYLYAIYFQNLPLWCDNCGSFNPQWGFLVTNFSDYRWNTDDSDRNRVNVQFSVEDQNRSAAAGFERTEEMDNYGGSDDSDPQDLVWQHWMNLQLSGNQNSSAVQRTEEEEEELDNYGGNDYREEIIWKYLITRDCRKCGNKEEEGEICVICQNKIEEDEVFKRLDCRHDYHYECISQWLLLKNSCPLCLRTVLPPDFESDIDFYFNYD